jgi:outer membrane protein assembly factor BamB
VRQHLLVGLLTLAALAGGCANGDKDSKTPDIKPVPINSFHRSWRTELGMGNARPTNVYVFDTHIIVYSTANNAHVVERSSGALKWIHPLPQNAGEQHAPSVFDDRIVYPATSALKVYSSKDGKLQRDLQVDFAIHSGGTGMGQFYYVSANYPNGGRLVALDLERTDSLPRWEVMTVAPMRSAPVTAGSITYFAAEDGVVRAVNEQRASIWGLDDTPDGGFKAGGPIFADLTVDTSGGTVYVASMDTKLYALAQGSGLIKWRYYAGVPLYDKPDVTSDTVYQQVRGRGLVAINKTEGKDFREPRWVNGNVVKFLADDDKHTFVLTGDGAITALDKTNGQVKWKSSRRDFVSYGTNTKDGQIYAVTHGGELWCIKPVTKVGVVGEIVMIERPLELAVR